MPVEQISSSGRQTIGEIEASLNGMMSRLQAILGGPPLVKDTLVEIMSIYNNVAYIFLYLEAIDDEENYQRFLPQRARFHEDPVLDARLLALMTEMTCNDPEVEEARLEFVDQLRKGETYDRAADERISELLNEAKGTLEEIRESQSSLLARIGVKALSANPPAVFYKLLGQTKSATTRSKLARAWQTVRDRHLDELVPSIDAMIEVRRADSSAGGYSNVLARSLERSRTSPTQIEPFLDAYVRQALESHSWLESEIREVTGTLGQEAADHFPFAMKSVFAQAQTPLFALDECLDFIFAVAHSVFGLTLERQDDAYTDLLTYDVRNTDGEVGQIKFDLWNRGQKIFGNYTRGIRNRTDWSDLVQRPVAYVACRFQVDQEKKSRITFQNVHSLFHEFGHAVNHLLIRKRLSYQSGLEYLPPERLECLSMWFEKWVYHTEFSRYLSLSDDDAEALSRCGRIKKIEYRRTYVERAVSAALDYEVHTNPAGGLEDAYKRLAERLDISAVTTFGDFPAYFTWPMYMSKPGANFSYLWGSADSCQKFAFFSGLDLAEIASRPGLRELFRSSFDFDAPSEVPDPAAVFSFYDDASLTSMGLSA